ncbi:hypothetical protein Tco_1386789 [Tanacetum coccineum]
MRYRHRGLHTVMVSDRRYIGIDQWTNLVHDLDTNDSVFVPVQVTSLEEGGGIGEVLPLAFVEFDLETLKGYKIDNAEVVPIPLVIVALVMFVEASLPMTAVVVVVGVGVGEVAYVVHVAKYQEDCWAACGAQFTTPPTFQQEMVKEMEMKREFVLQSTRNNVFS